MVEEHRDANRCRTRLTFTFRSERSVLSRTNEHQNKYYVSQYASLPLLPKYITCESRRVVVGRTRLPSYRLFGRLNKGTAGARLRNQL